MRVLFVVAVLVALVVAVAGSRPLLFDSENEAGKSLWTVDRALLEQIYARGDTLSYDIPMLFYDSSLLNKHKTEEIFERWETFAEELPDDVAATAFDCREVTFYCRAVQFIAHYIFGCFFFFFSSASLAVFVARLEDSPTWHLIFVSSFELC